MALIALYSYVRIEEANVKYLTTLMVTYLQVLLWRYISIIIIIIIKNLNWRVELEN